VELHTEPGTAATASMDRMLDDCDRKLRVVIKNSEERQERLQRIEKQLLDAARQLSG
jgi:hypothetical protein